MKLFSVVLFLFSSFAFAKNKVLYTVQIPGMDPKQPPTYELFVIPDFKAPVSRSLDKGGISNFTSTSDIIAYIREDETGNKLFIITNFVTMSKIEIATTVTDFNIKNNALFYTVLEKTSDKVIKNLYVITDFKTLAKYKLKESIHKHSIDED